ncbi:MAG TPA: hypothetical protein VFJ89_06090 [Nocardioides sp.]|jgi:hypothetical protein|nr:hypothetical protein [Nocardioides sp.]
MSDDRARPRVLGRASPARAVLLTLLAYLVAGAVAGVVWEWLWTPPLHIVRDHQVYYADYESLRRVFSATGLYAVIAAVASGLVAVTTCLATRRRELLTLPAVAVGSVLAAVVMRLVGGWLGPADPMTVAATAANNTRVPGNLTISGHTAYLVWPMVSLFVLALVFFAWPGAEPHASYDEHPDPAEAGIPGAERR